MNWWNKRKRLLLVILGVLLVIGVVIIGMWAAGPVIGCTLMGCVGGLDIHLTGLPSPDYQIEISFPSGETQTLNCGPGVANESAGFEKSCTSDGAFFALSHDVTPQKNVTVTVIVDGKTYSQEFFPGYEKFQPNGKHCPPTCYNATIEMKITP